MNQRLKTNEPSVISESMDSELVVINLETGCYYSLNESAAIIWKQLENGMMPTDIAVKVFDASNHDPADLSFTVESFCQYLVNENLMIETNEALSKTGNSQSGLPYVKPVIEKFADMQDMLLLDPIHEVNDKGWPHEAK